jgi:hypothetical protein
MNDFQFQLVPQIRNRRRSLRGVIPLLQGGDALGVDHEGDEVFGEADVDPYWIVAPGEQSK